MAEEKAAIHPGSWLGDAAEEFKKAPTGVKVGIVVAFLAVAGIGYYEYSKSQSSSSGVSGQASPSIDTTGAGGGANQYPTVPGGNTGNVPVLPGGLQPLFDAAGNLIAFEPPGTTGGTTTGGTTGGTGKTGGGTKKKKSKGSSSSGSSKSGGHTVKDHQSKGSQHKPSVSNSGHSQPKSNNKVSIQPKNTGGSHGYVYTTKPGDTLSSLQAKFFPSSSGSNAQGNIVNYGNNLKILTAKNVNPHTGAIKPGTKILA